MSLNRRERRGINELKTRADEKAKWVCAGVGRWVDAVLRVCGRPPECFSFSLKKGARSSVENMDGGRAY